MAQAAANAKELQRLLAGGERPVSAGARLMDVLAVIHGEKVRAGVFGDVVRGARPPARGVEPRLGNTARRARSTPTAPCSCSAARCTPTRTSHHPWLREENLFLQRLLDLHKPMLGVCLGAQLLAKAAHAPSCPAREPEIGWYEVELTDAARGRSGARPLPRTVRRVPVALLRPRLAGGRGRARAQPASARRRSGSATAPGASSSIRR